MSLYIAFWIHQSCDILESFSKDARQRSCQNMTYSHVSKMRFACSHFFDNIHDRGTNVWRKEKNETWSRNSFLSHTISKYMKSFQRRKMFWLRFLRMIIDDLLQIRDEQVFVSVRVVNQDLLRRLYEKNEQYSIVTKLKRLLVNEYNNRIWNEHAQRVIMQCMYAIAFLCLLRFDEMCHIQHHHIRVLDFVKEVIEITLSFRKIAQVEGTYDTSDFYFYSI